MNAHLKTRIARHGIEILCCLTVGGLGLAVLGSTPAPKPAAGRSPAAMAPPIRLTATIRDFRAREHSRGHTDFEWTPGGGFGHYIGQVADTLDADGLPVFASSGYKVREEWQDATGRNIMNPRSYIDAKPGDVPGLSQPNTGNSLHNASAFAQWYRDVENVNQSYDTPLTLNYDADTGCYIFDERTDPAYSMLGGFFPIDGKLLGNYGNTGHNYGFTCMIETRFTYTRDAGYIFTFRGDDDVWVFVDGKLVIDLGGVHGGIEQSIELDRLNWLVDGKAYSLRFFFAERHTTESNFRIESNFVLEDTNGHRRPAIKGWEEVEPKN